MSKISTTTVTPSSLFTVHRILQGFEFGSGTISGAADDPRTLATVDDLIHNDPEILIAISKDNDGNYITDDGCGDGRRVNTIFSYNKVYKRSLNRSKVFGGAATMGIATLIGTGKVKHIPLDDVFAESMHALSDAGLDFGAHTDESASASQVNCGCGAIDKAPQIIMAALKYETPIRQAIAGLEGIDINGLDIVSENYRHYVADLATYIVEHPDYRYRGKRVMGQAIEQGIVVKQLGGEHREKRIVLNQVRGYTVNQKLIRDATNQAAQIFAVDVWRLQDIARALEGPETQNLAFLSELVYTLATAAVLTKGDLPVDIISSTQSA